MLIIYLKSKIDSLYYFRIMFNDQSAWLLEHYELYYIFNAPSIFFVVLSFNKTIHPYLVNNLSL